MAKTVKELSTLVEELIAANTSLEQRMSNYAARANALHRASRDEIRAMRDELAALKAQRMPTRVEPLPAVPRITAAQFAAAHSSLKARNGETRTFFPTAEIRGEWLRLSRLNAGAQADAGADADAPCDEEVEL